MEAISLDKVRLELMRGRGRVENVSGWCQFVDGRGRRQFVIDGDLDEPVPYRAAKFSERLFGAHPPQSKLER